MLFRGVWTIAHQFVDDFTKKKMSIYGDDYAADILKLVPASNLEKKYGGACENVTTFWPPVFV